MKAQLSECNSQRRDRFASVFEDFPLCEGFWFDPRRALLAGRARARRELEAEEEVGKTWRTDRRRKLIWWKRKSQLQRRNWIDRHGGSVEHGENAAKGEGRNGKVPAPKEGLPAVPPHHALQLLLQEESGCEVEYVQDPAVLDDYTAQPFLDGVDSSRSAWQGNGDAVEETESEIPRNLGWSVNFFWVFLSPNAVLRSLTRWHE